MTERSDAPYGASRGQFDKWLLEVMGLQSEWIPERNCYADFGAHCAWKAV